MFHKARDVLLMSPGFECLFIRKINSPIDMREPAWIGKVIPKLVLAQRGSFGGSKSPRLMMYIVGHTSFTHPASLGIAEYDKIQCHRRRGDP